MGLLHGDVSVPATPAIGNEICDDVCVDFFLTALSQGYDVCVAATPLDVPNTFHYVGDCATCGNALGLAPDTLQSLVARLGAQARSGA